MRKYTGRDIYTKMRINTEAQTAGILIKMRMDIHIQNREGIDTDYNRHSNIDIEIDKDENIQIQTGT